MGPRVSGQIRVITRVQWKRPARVGSGDSDAEVRACVRSVNCEEGAELKIQGRQKCVWGVVEGPCHIRVMRAPDVREMRAAEAGVKTLADLSRYCTLCVRAFMCSVRARTDPGPGPGRAALLFFTPASTCMALRACVRVSC